MRAARACLALVVLAIARPAIAAPPEVHAGKTAQGPSAADREAARTSAKRGYELFEQGDYKGAIASFRNAEDHFHAPPHWLYIARSMVKLGELIAGKEAYDRILAEKLAADAPQPFKEAQTSARAEIAELEARIPSLAINVGGTAAAQAAITMDGAPVKAEDLGELKLVDPGVHTVVAKAPGIPAVERKVTVKEGSNVERVTIVINTPSNAGLVAPILSFSIGGLALAAGGVTLGLALSHSTKTPQDQTLVKNLKIASVASFIGGGIGVGLGITFTVLRAKAKAKESAASAPRLSARVGPTSLAIEGAF